MSGEGKKKGKGGGQVESSAGFLGQVGLPRDGLDQVVHLQCKSGSNLPTRYSTKYLRETKIRILENFEFERPPYWISILNQFLLGQKLLVCLQANSIWERLLY
jgi:hypothetical protein